MAHDYRTPHPKYGTHVHCNVDAGQDLYRVAGSDLPVLVLEGAILGGRSVNEIVSDPGLRCQYAHLAVEGILTILQNRQQVAA